MSHALHAEQAVVSFAELGDQIADLYPTMQVIDTVALGWTDSQLFDGKFINHKLKQRAPKRRAQMEAIGGEPLGDRGAGEILQAWLGDPDAVQREVDQLHLMPERALRLDDFEGLSAEGFAAALNAVFAAPCFSVVIVGAGPVGALLASAIKRQLGDAISVLLIENRVSAEHLKKPYERRWMTNIPVALVQSLLHPAAVDICERSGEGGYTGVDLCTLETLALLSAREAGVRCLFTGSSDTSWLPADKLHLVIDASGGRWRQFADKGEEVFPGLHLKHCQARARGFGRFGLTHADAVPGECIDVLKKGAWLHPLYKGKVCKQSMLKVSDIPVELYSDLLAQLAKNNRDNKFYLWPGHQSGGRKRMLLIVNLSSAEHEALQKYIDGELSLGSLIQWPSFRSVLDARLQALLKLIKKRGKNAEMVRISRPFVLEPRMLDPDQTAESFNGVPVLSIGDSFFNGNPKSGNGLGVHLGHIATVAEQITTALQS